MTVTLDAVTQISNQVSAEQGGLTIDAVTFSDGGRGRVEVLVGIDGCHSGQCRLSVNVTRADGAEFEREFRTKLNAALIKHRPAVQSE
jgi:hypothetical protein